MKSSRRSPHRLALACLLALPICALAAEPSGREVNFTGPLVTSGPPLPQGLLVVEPYFVQTQVTGRYDAQGRRHGVDGVADDWRVAVPILYGVTDRLTVAATLRGIYARTDQADRRWAAGDTTLVGQYTVFQGQGSGKPVVALGVRQNMPTGRHDQLDRHGLADATGSGAASTMLGLYGQTTFLPDRNLRVRGNLYYRVPGAGVKVRGRSGYGTAGDYHGRAHLGEAWQAVAGVEYSFNPRWVLAADALYEREQGTRLHGRTDGFEGVVRHDARGDSSWRLSLAPAVEYHWSPKIGVVAGALVSVDGRNSAELFSPQVAVNMVF